MTLFKILDDRHHPHYIFNHHTTFYENPLNTFRALVGQIKLELPCYEARHVMRHQVNETNPEMIEGPEVIKVELNHHNDEAKPSGVNFEQFFKSRSNFVKVGQRSNHQTLL